MVSTGTPKGTLIVSPGMVTVGANPNPAATTMHARYAATHFTQPQPALYDLTPIITPLMANQWEAKLINANIYNTHIHVINGICHGFDMRVHSIPCISFIPSNHVQDLSQNHTSKA